MFLLCPAAPWASGWRITLYPYTRACADLGDDRMLTARDIMTDAVITVRPTCTIQEAIELLLAERISGLPVVDDRGRLVGIVTEFALLAVAYDEKVLGDAVSQHM